MFQRTLKIIENISSSLPNKKQIVTKFLATKYRWAWGWLKSPRPQLTEAQSCRQTLTQFVSLFPLTF